MIGILLAAGHSRRFGPHNKLTVALADGRPLALAAAHNLIAALPRCIAVVRPEPPELAACLHQAGAETIICTNEMQFMADSLVAAVRHSRAFAEAHDGWIVALADMPFIRPATIRGIAARLAAGDPIVVPTYQGRRGHPVGFAARFADELQALQGDRGARSVLERHAAQVCELAVDDPGILIDIDTDADARQWLGGA